MCIIRSLFPMAGSTDDFTRSPFMRRVPQTGQVRGSPAFPFVETPPLAFFRESVKKRLYPNQRRRIAIRTCRNNWTMVNIGFTSSSILPWLKQQKTVYFLRVHIICDCHPDWEPGRYNYPRPGNIKESGPCGMRGYPPDR